MVMTSVQIKSQKWLQETYDAESICLMSADAVWRHQKIAKEQKEATIVLADDRFIQELNYKFRNKNEPTDVLSFPADNTENLSGDEFPSLGDIVLAFETTKKEVINSFSSHLSHLVVHGCLHLLGYDHQENKQAVLMESIEVKILSSMGIDNPY